MQTLYYFFYYVTLQIKLKKQKTKVILTAPTPLELTVGFVLSVVDHPCLINIKFKKLPYKMTSKLYHKLY